MSIMIISPPTIQNTYRDIARNKELLKSLLRTSGRLFSIEGRRLKFITAGVDEYTNDDIKFRELILLAINWTAGLTGRGTEMLSLLYKNKMAAARNLIVQDGQIVIVTEYHKSQSIMD